MLLTQYAAAKAAGVSKQMIHKKVNLAPTPGYVLEVIKNGKTEIKIDDTHPEWKMYIQKQEMKAIAKEASTNNFEKLIAAVVGTIKERYSPGEDELDEVLDMINEKYQAGK